MLTYVLDASAVLRYLDKEAGSDSVEKILSDSQDGISHVVMSAAHWGEVIVVLLRRYGSDASVHVERLSLPLSVITIDAERAERTAAIRDRYKIPYVDNFGLELASSVTTHTLVTADFDVKPAERDYRIEFLPLKPTQ